MSDIKLYRIKGSHVKELDGQSVAVEKSLQNLIESHLEEILDVKLLDSEHSTGKSHGGRVDTLGIDENGSPVIIEYKRSLNENVINQGLFYLDWLLDHKAEFKLLVMDKYGHQLANSIEWDNARLLCIAGEFTKYDEHAVKQMNRNIELIRYRRFHDDLLLLELVNASSSQADGKHKPTGKTKEATVMDLYEKMGDEHKDRYEMLKAFMLSLGDDIQEKKTKFYIAFKRIANFACFEFHPNDGEILVFVKVDPDSIELEEGFTRDVSKIGHFGTGDLEIRIKSDNDALRAQPLIMKSYGSN
jgi:predicted transport protein